MTSIDMTKRSLLLGKDDPLPVEIVHPDSTHPLVLVCEHAGNLIPNALHNLGLSQSALKQHIAWDIGAEKTARKLADILGATLILQRYSRLVIDCNRPPYSEGSILTRSDGIQIKGNTIVSSVEEEQRIEEIFEPFQQAVKKEIRKESCKMAISVHSFTRTMNQIKRPWDIGFLYRHDEHTSQALAQGLAVTLPGERIGMNQPYQIDDTEDWFVPKQGEASGKCHSLIEICNDQISTEEGQGLWAKRLAMTINRTVKRMTA